MMGNEGDILKSLAAHLSDGVVTVNESGKVVSVNDALTAHTGYSTAEVIGRSFATLFPPYPESTGRHPLEQTLLRGEVTSYATKFRGRTFDVTLLPCRVEGPLPAASARAVAVVKSDVMTADPRAARLQMVGLFATGVVHDVNNDLTAIFGNIQMAEAHLGEIEEGGDEPAALAARKARQHLSDADRVTKHTSALARHLLAYARQREPEREAINANDTIRETVELTRKLMSPNITIELRLEESLRPIFCERTQFDRILTNLLLNSCEAMPDGGRIRIETAEENLGESFKSSRPAWAKTGCFVRLSVIDTGKGMDDGTLKRIYDDFFTTKAGGMGIGLRNVYHIVKDHGGMIEASSRPGEGSRFDVYLPPAEQRSVTRAEEHAGDASPRVLREARGSRLVMVVEQHEPLRKIMEVMLRQAGYRVVKFEASRRTEGLLEMMSKRDVVVDVAAIDLSLPAEEVRALIRKVKDSNEAASVLLTSATENEVPEHLSAPGLRLLRKPFNGYQLVGAIDAYIEGSGGDEGKGMCVTANAGRADALLHK
ncbi:MAG: ATP-binding protein [Pyrinomonadaceae bacterium]